MGCSEGIRQPELPNVVNKPQNESRKEHLFPQSQNCVTLKDPRFSSLPKSLSFWG